jgi:hypothetical protein
MRLALRTAFFLSALLLAPCLPAQTTNNYVNGSTVSGHVLCADTNAPARFAKVLLKSSTPDHAGEDMMNSMLSNIQKAAEKSGDAKPLTPDRKAAMATAARGMNQVTDMLSATTVGLDGAYSFAGVKPGTYYVHAILPGYIDPVSQFSDEDFASTDPAVRARIAQLPTITVTGTDSAHADVRLERGAAVSGRITYDDGTPASGWSIAVVKPKTQEDPGEAIAAAMAPALAMGGMATVFKTDDLGSYRISGLNSGEIVLRVSLTATPVGVNAGNISDGGSGIALTVYSGNTFDRAAAKAIKLIAGDEIAGVDITIPSHKLHSIAGHVVSKDDGHTLNMGQVTLTDKNNPALHLMAAIRDDGSFHFECLPGGISYTVTVADAADGRHKPSRANFMGMNLPDDEILRKYGTDSTNVLLADSDVDSVKLSVAQTDWKPTPGKSGSSTLNPADLLKGLLGGDDSTDDSTPPK